MKSRLSGFSAVGVLVLAGCGSTPEYLRPAVDLPEAYATQVAGRAAPHLADAGWRQVFVDPPLQSLIETALAAGPDVQLADAQVRETAALAGLARAAGKPNVGLELQSSPTARAPGDRLTTNHLGGLGVSWEVDLWGRYARANDAARADLLAREENRNAVTASLIGTVANLYYQLAALRAIESVTQENAANQQEALRLVRRLSRAGVVSAAEERQQESALAATEARLPTLARQITETENSLALLVGRLPGAAGIDLPAQLAAPATAPAGLPSQLLERRPDIRRAEAQLKAAYARVDEARARFFPTISLTGVLGGVSTHLGDLLRGDGASVVSLGPNLLQPILDGGARVANRDAALARLDQALIVYRRTVNAALAEVADSLKAYETSARLLDTQARRAAAARDSRAAEHVAQRADSPEEDLRAEWGQTARAAAAQAAPEGA
jgi:multidrug efflux system outer membrane protein